MKKTIVLIFLVVLVAGGVWVWFAPEKSVERLPPNVVRLADGTAIGINRATTGTVHWGHAGGTWRDLAHRILPDSLRQHVEPALHAGHNYRTNGVVIWFDRYGSTERGSFPGDAMKKFEFQLIDPAANSAVITNQLFSSAQFTMRKTWRELGEMVFPPMPPGRKTIRIRALPPGTNAPVELTVDVP